MYIKFSPWLRPQAHLYLQSALIELATLTTRLWCLTLKWQSAVFEGQQECFVDQPGHERQKGIKDAIVFFFLRVAPAEEPIAAESVQHIRVYVKRSPPAVDACNELQIICSISRFVFQVPVLEQSKNKSWLLCMLASLICRQISALFSTSAKTVEANSLLVEVYEPCFY